MKLTLQDHIDDFRTAIGDNYYTESSIIRYVNKAQQEIVKKMSIQIPIKRTMSTVANQEEYTIPSLVRKIENVRVEERPLQYWEKWQVENISEGFRDTTGQVDYYWREGNQLGLYYIPDASADSTALYAAVNSATITALTVDYDAALPDRGSGIVNSEVVHWTTKTDTGTTYSTLSGLTRGAEGTKATTHSIDSTFTWRDIEIFGQGYPSSFINKPNAGSVAIAAGGSIDAGVHTYYMTYYSTSLAMESLPYLVGSVTATDGVNQTASLSSLAVSTNSDVDYKRIYRTLAGGVILYYVGEVANATTTYSDTDNDTTVGANDRQSNPYSAIDEEYHDLINYLSFAKYFEDREEMKQAFYWRNMYNNELGESMFDNIVKNKSEYTQKPLPE